MPSAGKYFNYNNDPAQNQQTPPVGAPEDGTQHSDVNNIQRYTNAAIADLVQDVVTEGIGAQTPAAVNFTGGSIIGLTAARAAATFTPTDNYDLATKTYVDDAVAGAVAGPVQALIDATLETTVPVGTVFLWNGLIANIPTFGTWQLCDGTNGTLDLRSIMIKGCDQDANLGNTGGSTSATTDGTALTEAQIPNHKHSLGTLGVSLQPHKHLGAKVASGNNPPVDGNTTITSSDAGGGTSNAYALGGVATEADAGQTNEVTVTGSITGEMGDIGSGQPHDHPITLPEPVHRRIYFIQRTA